MHSAQRWIHAELPNLAALLAHHGVALLAAEGRGEGRHVREWPVGAESRQRMRVGVGHQARIFQALIGAPDLCPAEK